MNSKQSSTTSKLNYVRSQNKVPSRFQGCKRDQHRRLAAPMIKQFQGCSQKSSGSHAVSPGREQNNAEGATVWPISLHQCICHPNHQHSAQGQKFGQPQPMRQQGQQEYHASTSPQPPVDAKLAAKPTPSTNARVPSTSSTHSAR